MIDHAPLHRHVDGFAEGDIGSLTAVYDETAELMSGVAMGLLGSRRLAQDILPLAYFEVALSHAPVLLSDGRAIRHSLLRVVCDRSREWRAAAHAVDTDLSTELRGELVDLDWDARVAFVLGTLAGLNSRDLADVMQIDRAEARSLRGRLARDLPAGTAALLTAEPLPAITTETRGRHLDFIHVAKRVRAERTTTSAASRRPSRGLVGLVAVGVFLGGIQTAAAAQLSVPGEALHRVKLLVEPVQQIFDQDAALKNRLAEVGALLARPDVRPEVLSMSLEAARAAAEARARGRSTELLALSAAVSLRLATDSQTASAEVAAKPEKGDKPKGDKPKADKPKADKPKADKPKADKPKADKPNKAEDDKPDKPAKAEDDKPDKQGDDEQSDAEDREKPKDDAPKPEKSKPTETGGPDDKNPNEQGS